MNDTKMTDVEVRATWSLCTIFSLRMLGMFMILPVLTIYGMNLRGASELLIGLAIGIYGLVQAIFQIPFGLISDRIGRKPLILIGLLIFAFGSSIAALTENIWGIILGRALQGSGAISGVVIALLSDLIREQNRIKAMAFIGVSFGMTFATAITVGPIVTYFLGLNNLFWCITALSLFGVILTLLVVPDSINNTLNRESNIISSCIRKVLINPQLIKLNVSIFFLHTILMSSFVALPLVIVNAGVLPNEQWKIYLITILVSFIIAIPVMIYAEAKHYMKRVFLICVMLLVFSELILLLAMNHLWLILIGIQLFFLAFNLMEAIIPSMVGKESPVGYKGTAMGIYSTSQFLGVAFGGTLGGFLLQTQGAWLIFLVGSVIAFFWWNISITLCEPPYISNLCIALPNHIVAYSQAVQRLQEQPGVTEVVVVPEECKVYVKIDTKQTNRAELEKVLLI